MPDYEITSPDGRRFVISAPEGASPDDVLRYAQQNAPAAPERTALQTAGRLAGQFGAGVGNGVAGVVGAPFDMFNRGLRAVGVPIPEGSVSQSLQGGINRYIGDPGAPEGTAEHLARGAGRGAVDAGALLVPAAGVARATQAVGGVAPSMLNRGATMLASQPVLQTAAGMTGGAVGEATDSPLAGFAASMAVPLGAAAAGRVISPVRSTVNAERAALVQAAEREGIPLTAGQATGNRFLQNVESQFEQLPLTSTAQRAVREGQERAFTRASLRHAGVESEVATPDVLNAARNQIGGEIGAIANRNVLQLDQPAMQQLAALENDLIQNTLPDVGGVALNRLRQIVEAADNQGDVPGTFYRQMDSALGRQIRGTQNGDLKAALDDVRQTLRQIMDRSISPQDSANWARARRQYANLMVSAKAVGGAGGRVAEGQISPLALRGALDQSTGRGYAFGRGDQNELARIGQAVVRAPPDSGTAGRSFANNLLTGTLMAGGSGAGALAAGPAGAILGSAAPFVLPRIAQALMNSPAGQAYLRNQTVQNPVLTRRLATALAGQQGLAALTRP